MKYTTKFPKYLADNSESVPIFRGNDKRMHKQDPNIALNLERWAKEGRATPSDLRKMGFDVSSKVGQWSMNLATDRFEHPLGFSHSTIPKPGARTKNGHSIEASEAAYKNFTELKKYGDEMSAPINDVGLKVLHRLIAGIAATDRYVLVFYADDGSKPYGYTVHIRNVSNVLSQLKDAMDPDGVIEKISPDGEQRTSDSSLVYHLRTKTSLSHWVLAREPDHGEWKGPNHSTFKTRAEWVKAVGHPQQAGAFFNYTLKEELPDEFKDQFKRLQIFDSVQPEQEACLAYALEQAGLNKNQMCEVRGVIINPKVPLLRMPLIARAASAYIQVRRLESADKNGKRRTKITTYGEKTEHPIKLCLIGGHYFVDIPMNVTSYCMSNWSTVCNKKRAHEFKSEKTRSTSSGVDSFNAVRLLLAHEDDFLDPIGASDLALQTIQYERKNISFEGNEIPIADSCSYGGEKCDPSSSNYVDPQEALFNKHVKQCVDPMIAKAKKRVRYKKVFEAEKNHIRVVFDFESNTSEDVEESPGRMNGGAHVAYLCATYCEELGSQQHDNAKAMMDYLKAHFGQTGKSVLLLAHNSTYDFCFLQEVLSSYKMMQNGGAMIRAEGSYFGLKFEIHNTYRLIPEPLRKFGELFDLPMSKEIMPYDLYTTANIEKGHVPLEECLSHLSSKEDKFWYESNCIEWECLNKDREVDIVKYSGAYCVKDVEVLYHGYMAFRKIIYGITQIDCDCMLTLPAIGHSYCIKEGVFEGVEQLSGMLREYVQKSVCGGRTMVRDNQKCCYTGPMEDFDEVSMYVGAAVKILGYLMGKAKNFTPEQLADRTLLDARMKEVSGYHCKILITKVGKTCSIPLLNRLKEGGGRHYTNEMVGYHMYVDKTTLEDLVEFHKIEYEVVNGIYFNEGFNPTINRVQQGLFDQRLKAKEDGNDPLSTVLKLLSNSIYGRTLLAPKDTNTTWVPVKTYKKTITSDDGEEQPVYEPTWDHYRQRHFENIIEYSENRQGTMVRVQRRDPTQSHANYVHCGCAILSQSKRSMSEVMFLALDMFPGCIYITDTDSMHIPREMIQPIADKFREVYGRELIGKNLQQFHVDFSLKNGKTKCVDVHGVDAVFLGKKAYCDVLQGTDPNTGETVSGYHYRMKGIPPKSIAYYCRQRNMEIIGLYRQMYKGKRVTFDLLADSVSFQYMKDGTVRSRRKFLRTVGF